MNTFENIVAAGNNKVLFAVPKKGRLHGKVLEILKGAGLEFVRLPRLDIAECKRLPIRLVFLPSHDIPKYVGAGHCQLGITGEDVILESGMQEDIEVMTKLGFGQCRLCVQAPQGSVNDINALCGKRIVTSFPNAAKRYFDELDSTKATTIRYVSGSVEVACALGLADAVVDLVETGTTMRAAGLEIVSTIMETQCVLIKKKDVPESVQPLVARVFQRIQGYMIALEYMMVSYNCPADKLELAKTITPGKESPSVTALNESGWVSVSSLVKSNDVADVMDRLVELGGKSILTIPLANCRFP